MHTLLAELDFGAVPGFFGAGCPRGADHVLHPFSSCDDLPPLS